jgi:hypothetical protein
MKNSLGQLFFGLVALEEKVSIQSADEKSNRPQNKNIKEEQNELKETETMPKKKEIHTSKTDFSKISNLKEYKTQLETMPHTKEIQISKTDFSKIPNLKEYKTQLETNRNEIIERLNKLNESLMGSAHPENLRKITELEANKTALAQQLNNLEQTSKTLKAQIDTLSAKVEKLSDNGKLQKLFTYLNDNRWFFFRNKKMFFMDKQTGNLWGNPEMKITIDMYHGEMTEFVKELKLDGLDNWQMPSKIEVEQICSNFPFDINGIWTRTRYSGESYNYYSHSSFSISDHKKLSLLPVHSKLTKYSNKLNSGNAEAIIDVFITQNWIPKFDNDELDKTYSAYTEKIILQEALQKLETEYAELMASQNVKGISIDFNYRQILMSYNIKESNSSSIKYYGSCKNWINELISGLDEFEQEQHVTIADIMNIQKQLNIEYEENQSFSEAENDFFSNKVQDAIKLFDFTFTEVKNSLYKFLKESEQNLQTLNAIDQHANPIEQLAIIESKPRPDFAVFADYTGLKLEEKFKKFAWFEENSEAIKQMIGEISYFYQEYLEFIETESQKFKEKNLKESIDAENIDLWFSEWRRERFLILNKLHNVLDSFGSEKKLSVEVLLNIFTALKNYQAEINNFYFEETANIHQKFAFQSGGDLQEKFEREMELSKINYKLSNSLRDIIFDCKSSTDKIYLVRWAKEWFDLQVDQIINFTATREIQDITPAFKEALDKIELLKRQNFEIFLNDVKKYTEVAKRNNDDYNSLMFKMRKELMKG